MTLPRFTIKQYLGLQEASLEILHQLITQDDTLLFEAISYAKHQWGIEPEWNRDGKEEGTRYEQWKMGRIDSNEDTDPSNLCDSYLDSVRDNAEKEILYSEVLSVDLHTPDDDAEYVAFVFSFRCGVLSSEACYYFHSSGEPYRIEFYHACADGDTVISIPRDSETWLWLWDFMMGEDPFEVIRTLR